MIALVASCDTGLEPPRETVLSGTVVFEGGSSQWPAADSLFDMRVVAFVDYPPQNIAFDIINGRAWFTNDSLPYRVAETEWSIQLPDPAPMQIKYLVVAQQFGPNPLTDWRAVGVYAPADSRDEPTKIRVVDGKQYQNIELRVDFSDLPPQPF